MLDLMTFAVLPGLLLAAGALLARFGGAIFVELAPLSPYLATMLAAAIAWRFRQAKLVLSAAALLLGYSLLVLPGALHGDGYRAAALYLAVALGTLALIRERGLVNKHGLIRLGTLTAPALLVTALVAGGNGLPTLPLISLTPTFGASPVPLLAGLAAIAALGAIVVQLVRRRSPIEAGQAGALIAAMLAVHFAADRTALATFVATAAVILAVAVIQNGYRVAFHDELTGLPGRRALRALEATLSDSYVVAMLDVDHFKKFNDTYGHDRPVEKPGDDTRTKGKGKAKAKAESKPKPEGMPAPGERKQVQITISIGAAAWTAETPTPETVMKAADLALYRAKEKGRNQVST